MSAQTQTHRVPAGYRWRCCKKAMLGIGIDESQALGRGRSYTPREVAKRSIPSTLGCETTCSSNGWILAITGAAAALRGGQGRDLWHFLQSPLLKRCGAGGLNPREGRQQVTRCCERELPACLAPRCHPLPRQNFPLLVLGTCFGFQGTQALMSPPERTAARGGGCVWIYCARQVCSLCFKYVLCISCRVAATAVNP